MPEMLGKFCLNSVYLLYNSSQHSWHRDDNNIWCFLHSGLFLLSPFFAHEQEIFNTKNQKMEGKHSEERQSSHFCVSSFYKFLEFITFLQYQPENMPHPSMSLFKMIGFSALAQILQNYCIHMYVSLSYNIVGGPVTT